MNHAIILRTYDRDLKWLKLSLPTIMKHCHGFSCIRVVGDKTGTLALEYARSIGCETDTDYDVDGIAKGYIAQQATKLRADFFVPGDTDAVLFFDSDCIVQGPMKPEDYMIGERIVMLYTPWSHVGDAKIAWQGITQTTLGETTEFEFMRRLPMAFNLSTIRDARAWLEAKYKMPMHDFLANKESFSEYNFLGAWAHRFEPDRYHWINTLRGTWKQLPTRQFWSHGDIAEMAAMAKKSMEL